MARVRSLEDRIEDFKKRLEVLELKKEEKKIRKLLKQMKGR